MLDPRRLWLIVPAMLLALVVPLAPLAISADTPDSDKSLDPTDLLTAPPPKAEVPGADAQKAALANIKELYQADYATAKLRAGLIDKLTDQALQTENDPAMRYALLHEARELAITGKDVAAVITLCEQIAKAYRGPDAVEQQRTILPRLSSVPVVASLIKLLDVPTDAYASGVVGRWYANEVQDWERALPLMVQGSDTILAKAATAEATAKATPAEATAKAAKGAEQAAVADQWYDIGKRTSVVKESFWRHALSIYEVAKTDLTGISLAVIEKRIAEIEAFLPLGPDVDYTKLTSGQWEKLKGKVVTVDASRGMVTTGVSLSTGQKMRVVPHPTETWNVTDPRGVTTQTTWKGGMAGRRALGSLQCTVGDGAEQAPGIVTGTGALTLFALVPNARRFQVTGSIRVKILPVTE
ncbi:MAG TPA: hypothetical protein VHX44_03320 [Planctomycetota bacterium]|nr:hypothetical protein [Planctomycetota bacterium]